MIRKRKPRQASTRAATLHKWHRIHLQLWIITITMIVIFVSYWGWQKSQEPNFLPINDVRIQGNFKHVDKAKLREIIEPYTEKGFLGINIQTMRQQLLTLPWIKEVEVSRVWPATITIKISEQKPVATWNTTQLINNEGQVFSPPTASFPKNLPNLEGPDDRAELAVGVYQQMQKALVAIDLHIQTVSVNDRLAWQIALDNGMRVLLGREVVLARLQRFIEVYPKLFANKSIKANYADMRYTNGMAINWMTLSPSSPKIAG